MSETTFTFRVDDSLKNEFASAAKVNDRSGAQLLRDFMRSYVQQQDYNFWFHQQVSQGLNSANAGKSIPNEVVEAEFESMRQTSLRKLKETD